MSKDSQLSSAFMAVELETLDGHFRAKRWIPKFSALPPIIFWGIRHFILRAVEPGKLPVYKEGYAVCVQENAFPNIPGRFPEDGQPMPDWLEASGKVDLVEIDVLVSLVTGERATSLAERSLQDLKLSVEMAEMLLRTLSVPMDIPRLAGAVYVWRNEIKRRQLEK